MAANYVQCPPPEFFGMDGAPAVRLPALWHVVHALAQPDAPAPAQPDFPVLTKAYMIALNIGLLLEEARASHERYGLAYAAHFQGRGRLREKQEKLQPYVVKWEAALRVGRSHRELAELIPKDLIQWLREHEGTPVPPLPSVEEYGREFEDVYSRMNHLCRALDQMRGLGLRVPYTQTILANVQDTPPYTAVCRLFGTAARLCAEALVHHACGHYYFPRWTDTVEQCLVCSGGL